MSKADSPNDLDLMQLAIRNQLALVHTALPAEVLKYDDTTQLADVQVLVRSSFINAETNELETYLPAPIPKVPVGWLSAGGSSITFPLSAGDQGFVLFAERSIDEWKQTGGKDITPRDRRRHNLSDAFFLPMTRAIPKALPSSAVDPTALVIAAALLKLGDSGAVDFVALAAKVDAELAKIKAAYDAHTHAGVTTGVGVTAVPIPLIPALSPTAATKVQAT